MVDALFQARATSIFMQAMMPRGILFILYGFLQEQALPIGLYVVCSVIALTGLVGGNFASKYVNQALFASLLNMLTIVAAFLMISAGSGALVAHNSS